MEGSLLALPLRTASAPWSRAKNRPRSLRLPFSFHSLSSWNLIINVHNLILIKLLEVLLPLGGFVVASLFTDVVESCMLGDSELEILTVLEARIFTTEMCFFEEETVLSQTRLFRRTLDLYMEVIVSFRCPTLPYDSLVDITPWTFL